MHQIRFQFLHSYLLYGYASSASQAIQFAAFEVLVELRYNDVRMQNHPGFHYYPSLHNNGRVRFPVIDPEFDSVASHLSLYITASYLLIYELARELSRARNTLASASSVTTPASVGFTPYIPASSRSHVSSVTPPSSSGTVTVSLVSAPAEWVSLLATPVAPMIHPPPAP